MPTLDRWSGAASAAAYVTLAASAFTRLYDPLPDFPIALSVALLVLPHLALGLAVGRWWAVPLPVAVALPWALAGSDNGNLFSLRLSALEILAVAALAAVVVLTGVLVATSADARLGRLRRLWPIVGAAALAAAFLPLGWSGVRSLRPVDERPANPLLVDELRGRVGGVALGDDVDAVTAAFGAAQASASAPIAPLGERFEDIAGPGFIATPGQSHSVVRYRDVSFLVSDAGVYAVIVTAARAETVDGAGVGDNLEVARDAYGQLECGIGETEDDRTFPYCAGRLANGRYAWFGDDPIRSIALATTELSAETETSSATRPPQWLRSR